MLNSTEVAAMRSTLLAIGTVFAMCFAGGAACAQDLPPKIWDIKLGTPISALPLKDFVDPACGTNGGPPARGAQGLRRVCRVPGGSEHGTARDLVSLRR